MKILLVVVCSFIIASCNNVGINSADNSNSNVTHTNRTNSNTTIAIISSYFPLSVNKEWTFNYSSEMKCYRDRFTGKAKWQVIQSSDSNFIIMETKSGIHYMLDGWGNPEGDTTFWGPDTNYINLLATSDTVELNFGYRTIFWFPLHFTITKDSIETKKSLLITDNNLAYTLGLNPDISARTTALERGAFLLY